MFGEENNEPSTVQNSVLDMEENVRRKQNNKNFAENIVMLVYVQKRFHIR
jgi:hypothetical protein